MQNYFVLYDLRNVKNFHLTIIKKIFGFMQVNLSDTDELGT